MNPRLVFVLASVAVTLVGEAFNLWGRRKLKLRLEGEVRRRDWTIAQSNIDSDELNEEQRSIREMLIEAGKYSYADTTG